MIKICHENGKYGFVKPYQFNSVIELINYYKEHSLRQYNLQLDIMLENPISRYVDDVDVDVTGVVSGTGAGTGLLIGGYNYGSYNTTSGYVGSGSSSSGYGSIGSGGSISGGSGNGTNFGGIGIHGHQGYHTAVNLKNLIKQFLHTHKMHAAQTQYLQQKKELYEQTESELNLKKPAHDAFNKAIKMFEDQIKLQEKFRLEALPHEIKQIDQNGEILRAKLKALRDSSDKLDLYLKQRKEMYHSIERDINATKPEVMNLSRKKEKLQE